MISAVRYLFVLVLCLAVSAASSSFLGSSAIKQLGTASSRPAAAPKAAVEVKVPDTPVVSPNAQPGPVAAGAPAIEPATPVTEAVGVQAVAAAPSTLPLEPAPAAIAAPAPDAPTDQSEVSAVGLDSAATAAQEEDQAFGGETLRVRSPVNIRSQPSGSKIGVIKRGEFVDVLSRQDGWVEIGQDGRSLGWVYYTFLTSR